VADGIARAKTPARIPVVLTREEVRQVIAAMDGPPRLAALLLYGAGLRLLEALRLRVKDVDFQRNQIAVRSGKGAKDRVTMLPAAASRDLAKHLEAVRELHRADVRCCSTRRPGSTQGGSCPRCLTKPGSPISK
jgi:integrase